MKIVIKIGGSVSIGESGPNFSYFKRLLPVLKKVKKHHQLIVVIGGGRLTRNYGKSIDRFPISSAEREEIFIELIRANVRFLSSTLKMTPIFSLDSVKPKTSGILGGMTPGRSTDANGALAARKIKADLFIKLTDVNGVYTADPKKFKNAKKLSNIQFSDMKKLAVKGAPNKYGVLDRLAIEALSRGGIKTVIISGKNPSNIEKLLKGKKLGTTIS